MGSVLKKNIAKEAFQDDPKQTVPEPAPTSTVKNVLVLFAVVGILVGAAIYAAVLSWRCNTYAGVSVIVKVVFAFFAALGNVAYLAWYALYQLNSCTLLKRIPEVNETPTPLQTGGRK